MDTTLRPAVFFASLLSLGLVPAAVAQLPPVPVPAGNPITTAKANLGKALFWDEQMSSTRTVACGTCHMPEASGSDPRTTGATRHPGPDGRFGTPDDVLGSPGVVGNLADGSYVSVAPFGMDEQVTGRRSQPVTNAAYHATASFWDGRASGTFRDPLTGAVILPNNAALESQVLEPPVSDVEMAHRDRDWNEVATRIAVSEPLALATDLPDALAAWIAGRSYPELFAEAFGTAAVTPARIAMAIATYERTLVSFRAPIDRFRQGQTNALNAQERRGLNIFNGPGRCDICHREPLFTRQQNGGPQGEIFFNIGVRPAGEDLGRFAVTGQNQHRGAFKIPSLRNVGLRAPYFHTGGKASLEEVVDFYNRGGDFRGGPQTNLIRPLGLSGGQRADLVAFLRNGLTDPRVAAGTGPFSRPTLYSESAARVPQSYGTGNAGSGGFVPRVVALEPPALGNPNMTVAVADALGGAPLLLLIGAGGAPGINVAGVSLWVDLTLPVVVVPGRLEGIGAGGGFGSLSLRVPATPGTAGASLHLQGVVVDGAAAQGLAGTDGVAMTLFAGR